MGFPEKIHLFYMTLYKMLFSSFNTLGRDLISPKQTLSLPSKLYMYTLQIITFRALLGKASIFMTNVYPLAVLALAKCLKLSARLSNGYYGYLRLTFLCQSSLP